MGRVNGVGITTLFQRRVRDVHMVFHRRSLMDKILARRFNLLFLHWIRRDLIFSVDSNIKGIDWLWSRGPGWM
jgi:hypothetical protein